MTPMARHEGERLDPDAAFSALGNDTRVGILRTLGEAHEPLSFSTLRDRVGLDQGEHFNYHLYQLVGHFIRKTDEGYELGPPGKRVVKAVLSGAVTESLSTERTRIDAACQLCGATIEARYQGGRVETFCTECSGVWGTYKQGEDGYLGGRNLPPAGTLGRSPHEQYRVAWLWMILQFYAIGNSVCPACSASLQAEVFVCEDHVEEAEFCENCDRRFAATLQSHCTNCIFELESTLPVAVVSHTELLDCLTSHGLNPISPESIVAVQSVFSDYEEEILSTDPFEARLTFSVEHERISFTLDSGLDVTDVTVEEYC